jgi:hypothetical protein
MSILSQAFQHTLDARERVVGVREKITLDGIQVDALVESIPTSPDPVVGGVANPDTFIVQIATDAFSARPVVGASVGIRDLTLEVLSIDDVNGITYHLIVGDASYE